ncbi:hypothetical protein BaRGS_00018161 [Batillaria attramentaria]|uniref:Uncharacterized protein n=1 Tax=Batillaria attramentaria TaxID=370345 RepID=A0ABD0KU42_9CAEN
MVLAQYVGFCGLQELTASVAFPCFRAQPPPPHPATPSVPYPLSPRPTRQLQHSDKQQLLVELMTDCKTWVLRA